MKTIHIPRTNSIAVNAMYTLIGLINIALPQAICQDLNLNTFRPEFSIYTPAVQNITAFKRQNDLSISIGGFSRAKDPVLPYNRVEYSGLEISSRKYGASLKNGHFSIAYAVKPHWAIHGSFNERTNYVEIEKKKPNKKNSVTLGQHIYNVLTGSYPLSYYITKQPIDFENSTRFFREYAFGIVFFHQLGNVGAFEVSAGSGFGRSINDKQLFLHPTKPDEDPFYDHLRRTETKFTSPHSPYHGMHPRKFVITTPLEHKYSLETKYHRLYVQPSFAFSAPRVNIVLACRISALDITEFSYSHNIAGTPQLWFDWWEHRALTDPQLPLSSLKILDKLEESTERISSLESEGMQVIAEPSVTLCAGFQPIKLQIQYTWLYSGNRILIEHSWRGRMAASVIVSLNTGAKQSTE